MLLLKVTKKLECGVVNASEYQCDMCKRFITKKQRYLVAVSDLAGDATKKKWDLCPKCMKTIEKNVANWYNRVINK